MEGTAAGAVRHAPEWFLAEPARPSEEPPAPRAGPPFRGRNEPRPSAGIPEKQTEKNTRTTEHPYRILLETLICAIVLGAGAQTLPPRGPKANMPAAPVYSRDGRIVIHAPMAKSLYRSPVLVFADRARQDLGRATRMKFEPENGILDIVIGNKSDGDKSVLSSRQKDSATGAVRERIDLPDAEHADLGRLRVAVCTAFLRLWITDAAPDPTKAADLPDWLLEGLVRYLNRETRQQDLDRTLLLWSRACLPPAAQLVAADSEAASKEPAVAAVLAGWLLEKKATGAPLEAILRDAARGEKWSVPAASKLLAGTDDPFAFDECLDRKLLADGRKIIVPGVTTDGVIARFRATLLLYTPLSDNFMYTSAFGKSFREAIAEADDPACRAEAFEQAGRVKLAAVGRDGTLLAVSDAYTKFLLALAQGEKPAELMQLLADAEVRRSAMEQRAAKGEVLSAESVSGQGNDNGK